ncbi:MAG: 30S ribosomal protein S18 [bacterium]
MAYRRSTPRNKKLPAEVSYRRPDLLKEYIDDDYKILPRRRTKLASNHQRQLTKEIKRARFLALLPYAKEH